MGLLECHRNSTKQRSKSASLPTTRALPRTVGLMLQDEHPGPHDSRPVHPRARENHASAGAPTPHSVRSIPAAPREPPPLREAQPRPGSPGSYHSEAGAGPATSPFRAGAEEDARPLRFPLAPAVRLGLSRRLRPCRAIQTP